MCTREVNLFNMVADDIDYLQYEPLGEKELKEVNKQGEEPSVILYESFYMMVPLLYSVFPLIPKEN